MVHKQLSPPKIAGIIITTTIIIAVTLLMMILNLRFNMGEVRIRIYDRLLKKQKQRTL